jgi:hypothetical protein
MKKAKKIIVEWSILDKIANSVILSQKEKLNFFRLVWYMTKKEQKELATLI